MITIVGTITNKGNAGREVDVPVYPLSGPMFQAAKLSQCDPVFFRCDENGAFSQQMAAGEYYVSAEMLKNPFNPKKRLKIRVPSTVDDDPDAEVDLEDLIPTGEVQLPEYFGGLPEEGGGGGGGGVDLTKFYSTAAALRARTLHDDQHLALVLCLTTPGDIVPRWYGYDVDSVSADNGDTVLKPDNVSGAGRWLFPPA